MRFTISTIFAAALAIGAITAKPVTHGSGTPPKGKVFDHILQIWFENQNYEVIANTTSFTKFQKEGILLNNFNAIRHPSFPNYIAAAAGSNLDIVDDDFHSFPANVTSIYDLLEKKGLSWKVYMEDLPYPGYNEQTNGEYARRHNPAICFDSIAQNPKRAANVVGEVQFQWDVQQNNLPNWMFYTPNVMNDGHDTNATWAGDWFDNFYENTFKNKPIMDNTLIMLTFDENAKYGSRNRVWTLLMGDIPKKLKGTTDDTFYTHYSTLNLVERNWDLGNMGRQDTNKTLTNIFDFATKKLDYKNTNVPQSQIPLMNETDPAFLASIPAQYLPLLGL